MKQMQRLILTIWIVSLIAGCTGTTPAPQAVITADAAPSDTLPVDTTSATSTTAVVASATPAAAEDVFSQMGITLPAPSCTSLTPSQMEGPYYTPNTPERNGLYEDGMPGTRLILVGYILDQNCGPLPNAWLDFWQADTNGEYDNQGYRLRGHQFTDAQGRYYLETVLPGLYQSRPIEHIHVKVRPNGGEEITTQLYFPSQPIEGLTVTLEERGDHVVGYFNFVVQK